ncbi:FAD-dependent oxidoreductase [Candidatus Micrarchaeota archaeon]|nr:FAD-dependent oxidoreductase [Candidatus Micrarchaeota archaeon]
MTRYRITSATDAVPGIRIFRLEPLGRPISFKPGQFAFLHILDEKGGTVVKRPYSIASAPGALYLEFCIKLVGGEMTKRLEDLAKGAVMGVEGGFGHFSYGDQPKAGFVGGGTGIAPLMAMLRHIADRKLDGAFVLFYSARTKDSIVYREELEELQRRNPAIKVVITLTREENPGDWKGECGRLDAGMMAKHVRDARNFDWWVCGQLEMVEGIRECLTKLGADQKRIRAEGWG